MSRKSQRTTTYSLEWNVLTSLESRILRDFKATHTQDKARELLMISIGSRLGLRVIDNLNLRWGDLADLKSGEQFVQSDAKSCLLWNDLY